MENIQVHIRWMVRRDMPEVLHIERNSFPNPWTEQQFDSVLRTKNCVGMVAEHADEHGHDTIAGFFLYELHKTRLGVLNFAVDPQYRHRGVGTQMVAKLVSKLSAQRRTRLTLDVRETNLPAQLFFRSQGFRAVNVIRGQFEDSDDDAYMFQYSVRRRIEAECSGV